MTRKSVAIVVQGDTTVEGNETLTLTLTNPVGATLLRATGTGTILNDDPAPTSTLLVQYRLSYTATGEHLYTTDLNEYNVLGTMGWLQEGATYRMFTGGVYSGALTIPMFRLYNTAIAQHHWTTDSNEVRVLSSDVHWLYEGIPGYLLPSAVGGALPLYRLALPSPPLHLWTIDAHEYAVLQTEGWIGEGVIGYALAP